MKQKKICLC